jgi:glycosyltransferase involved in cell wall biosynthesis
MAVEASFIVPTYRRAEILELSVPLFLAQDRPEGSFEIIVVSDGPDPATDETMARLAAPGVHYAALPAQAGPAAARNRAISMASGAFLVFVDDDSLVRSDFLSAHLACHAGTEMAMVSGPILDVTEPPDMRDPPPPGVFDYHRNPLPTGNGSVLRRHVEAAGGFDEAFKIYGWEDPELYTRLLKRGLKRRFTRSAPIYHLKPHAAERSLAYQLRREIDRARNGIYFYGKHPDFEVGLQTKQHPMFHAARSSSTPTPGQDDAVAILLALASPEEVEVLGITAVAGNVPLA